MISDIEGHRAVEVKKEETMSDLSCTVDIDETNRSSPNRLPFLFKHISIPKAVVGFDETPNPSPLSVSQFLNIQDVATENQTMTQTLESRHHHHRSISISMPNSPSQLQVVAPATNTSGLQLNHAINTQPPANTISHSQPLQTKLVSPNTASYNRAKDKRFDSYKTWSGKLERQLSNLRGIPQEPETVDLADVVKHEAIPAVDRYFESLEGPELENLKSSEELVLPKDKEWPFLLRFPITSFGMCLGVSSQAILWKTLATTPSMSFLHVSPTINLVLWCISLVLLIVVSLIYTFKIIFYFEAVRREYYHPVRVNFFFAPWITCLMLAVGTPPKVATNLHASLWYVLMTPVLCLELKIYGQWMSGGERRLSKVANPSNHLSIVGNFVGAMLGASMGLHEGPIFFFAIGLAHYIVLFVTLYQRLPTNETLPKELHPVFFLFIAAPSVACVAWAKITGDFGFGSRLAYFIALFLYISLAVRINFFRGFRFSLSWWAYTFPMTAAAVATVRYSLEVNNWLTQSLSVTLSAISTFAVLALVLSTLFHAFVLHNLFPNDNSIAIKEKSKNSSKFSRRRRPSSDVKDVEAGSGSY